MHWFRDIRRIVTNNLKHQTWKSNVRNTTRIPSSMRKHRWWNVEQMYWTAQAMGGQLQWQVWNRTVHRFRTIFIRFRWSGERRDKGRCRRASLSRQAGSVICCNDWWTVSRLEHTHLKIVSQFVLSEKAQKYSKSDYLYTFFAHILFPSAHSEISKIRKLKSVFDGLKINSRRFSAKIKD